MSKARTTCNIHFSIRGQGGGGGRGGIPPWTAKKVLSPSTEFIYYCSPPSAAGGRNFAKLRKKEGKCGFLTKSGFKNFPPRPPPFQVKPFPPPEGQKTTPPPTPKKNFPDAPLTADPSPTYAFKNHYLFFI